MDYRKTDEYDTFMTPTKFHNPRNQIIISLISGLILSGIIAYNVKDRKVAKFIGSFVPISGILWILFLIFVPPTKYPIKKRILRDEIYDNNGNSILNPGIKVGNVILYGYQFEKYGKWTLYAIIPGVSEFMSNEEYSKIPDFISANSMPKGTGPYLEKSEKVKFKKLMSDGGLSDHDYAMYFKTYTKV